MQRCKGRQKVPFFQIFAGRRVLGKQEAPTAGGKHLFNDPTLSTREVPYKGQKIQQPGVWIRTNQQWEEALPRTSSDLP